jgi:hypothetical protein
MGSTSAALKRYETEQGTASRAAEHRRDDIGAAAHGLGEDDLGLCAGE